jgi:cell division transport system permease protein
MVFIFNTVFSIRILTDEIFSFLNEKVDVSIEFQEDASVVEITDLLGKLQRQNFVKEAQFISSEDALNTVDNELIPGYSAFIKRYKLSNPFPPSLNVITYNVSDHQKVYDFIENSGYAELLQASDLENLESDTPGAQMLASSAAKELTGFSSMINSVLFVVLFLFGIASVAILINALYLSLKAKKRELSIMHIVGATEKYIALPYTYEGMYYGFFSVLIGLLVFHILVIFGGSELLPILFSPTRILLQIVFVTLFSGAVSFVMVHLALKGKIKL